MVRNLRGPREIRFMVWSLLAAICGQEARVFKSEGRMRAGSPRASWQPRTFHEKALRPDPLGDGLEDLGRALLQTLLRRAHGVVGAARRLVGGGDARELLD